MAELADEWPSLAPIRTSCSSSSSSYNYYEPSTSTYTHNSINSSCSPPLSLPHRTYTHNSINSSCSPPLSLPHRTHTHNSFQSPPSSSSSHVSFLHSSTTINHKNRSFLSKCFPPRPNSTSHGFPKQCINASPRTDMRRVHGGTGIFQSVASFPRQTCRPGSPACGAAANVTHLPGHSGSLKSKGHLANMNAFTMIPANVVGMKKPLDYLSDEPTSPEVTCIGRVRRRKHSTSTWDALLNSSEKLCKKTEAPRKKIDYSAARNLDHDLQLAYIPRPLSMGSSGSTPKWRKMVSLFKDIKGLHSPYIQRKLRQEDLVIDLSRLHAAWSAADRSFDNRIDKREMSDVGNGILYICQAGEGEEDSTSISQEEDGNDLKHVDAPLSHPNCLLLMHTMSSHSKVFQNHDDNRGGDKDPDPLALKPPADQMEKQTSSFWKSKKL